LAQSDLDQLPWDTYDVESCLLQVLPQSKLKRKSGFEVAPSHHMLFDVQFLFA